MRKLLFVGFVFLLACMLSGCPVFTRDDEPRQPDEASADDEQPAEPEPEGAPSEP